MKPFGQAQVRIPFIVILTLYASCTCMHKAHSKKLCNTAVTFHGKGTHQLGEFSLVNFCWALLLLVPVRHEALLQARKHTILTLLIVVFSLQLHCFV